MEKEFSEPVESGDPSQRVKIQNSYINVDLPQNQPAVPLPPPETCIPKEYMNSSTIKKLVKKENESETVHETKDNKAPETISEINENNLNETRIIPEYMNVDLKDKAATELCPPIPPRSE